MYWSLSFQVDGRVNRWMRLKAMLTSWDAYQTIAVELAALAKRSVELCEGQLKISSLLRFGKLLLLMQMDYKLGSSAWFEFSNVHCNVDLGVSRRYSRKNKILSHKCEWNRGNFDQQFFQEQFCTSKMHFKLIGFWYHWLSCFERQRSFQAGLLGGIKCIYRLLNFSIVTVAAVSCYMVEYGQVCSIALLISSSFEGLGPCTF